MSYIWEKEEKRCSNYTSLKSLSSMKAKIGTTHKFIQTSSVHQAKKRWVGFFLKCEVTSELGPKLMFVSGLGSSDLHPALRLVNLLWGQGQGSPFLGAQRSPLTHQGQASDDSGEFWGSKARRSHSDLAAPPAEPGLSILHRGDHTKALAHSHQPLLCLLTDWDTCVVPPVARNL